MIRRVELSSSARKHLKRTPRYIVENLAAWADDVETQGLGEARNVPGYHDEPLHGENARAKDPSG
jgi:proteic killer suppression protein